MKRLIVYTSFAIILTSAWSCKKEEHRVIFEGGTTPVATASVADSIPLSYATQNDESFVLSWTNPNYQFNTGISSLDVNYTIEIDTSGSNFTNPGREVLSAGTSLSVNFTQAQINDYLLNQLQLKAAMSHNIEIRVTASLVGGAEPLISNVVKLTATPFAIPPKITPPASGNLYIVGSAVAGGWDNPITNPASQQFTQVSTTDYQITIPLTGDGEYKFISVNGLWDSDKQWSIQTEQASGDPSTLSYNLYNNGANVRAPSQSGTYLIDVDFQRGKVTLTKQ
ncbi:MAG TPA: SusE domain-containing protein [Chitinophagaceae bacterium]|nr:SusE domain-containing protein [Chitinophagaceae bacterium]